MHQDKMVVAIKTNGKVLRETGDTVKLPFGSEFTLLFKNLNSVRALIRVSIDGQDATKNTSLIIPANGSVELERFLDANNFSTGHRFKFIERTSKIENGPRGIRAEDGLIRVEYEYEVASQNSIFNTRLTTIPPAYQQYVDGTRFTGILPAQHMPVWTGVVDKTAQVWTSIASGTVYGTTGTVNALNASSSNVQVNSYKPSEPKNDIGITVAGSISKQAFVHGAWFPTDGQKHVMVLHLLGTSGDKAVTRPVMVKTKTECPTCGTANRSGVKFCRECGTNLQHV